MAGEVYPTPFALCSLLYALCSLTFPSSYPLTFFFPPCSKPYALCGINPQSGNSDFRIPTSAFIYPQPG